MPVISWAVDSFVNNVVRKNRQIIILVPERIISAPKLINYPALTACTPTIVC